MPTARRQRKLHGVHGWEGGGGGVHNLIETKLGRDESIFVVARRSDGFTSEIVNAAIRGVVVAVTDIVTSG